MTDTYIPPADRNGIPWREYVRSITFLDREPRDGEQPPVHVANGRIMLDGVPLLAAIDPNGVTIDLSPKEATIVTIPVHEDAVQIGRVENGTYTPHLLGGRHVHTPDIEGYEWVPEDENDPNNPYVMVSIMVAEVHVQ